MNFINAIITMIISFIATFALTLFFGFEDPVDEIKEKIEKQPLKDIVNILSPLNDRVIP